MATSCSDFREINAKWIEEGKAEGEALLYNTCGGANPIAVPEGNSADKFNCYYADG